MISFSKVNESYKSFLQEDLHMRKVSLFLSGMLTMALVMAMGATAFGVTTTTLKNVMVGGISIVVDGTKINPTDANGNKVDPIIYNGTTYLPVRAVGSALGKEVYWDGPNYTVYLGSMGGTMQNASVMLKDMTSIAGGYNNYSNTSMDNYGNHYNTCTTSGHYNDIELEYLTNMKYSRLKGTLYVPEGETDSDSVYMEIIADGHTIYTSPTMYKQSKPVNFDVNVTGYNDIKIQSTSESWSHLAIGLGDAGFYQ